MFQIGFGLIYVIEIQMPICVNWSFDLEIILILDRNFVGYVTWTKLSHSIFFFI